MKAETTPCPASRTAEPARVGAPAAAQPRGRSRPTRRCLRRRRRRRPAAGLLRRARARRGRSHRRRGRRGAPHRGQVPRLLRFDEPRIGPSLERLAEEVHAAGGWSSRKLAHSGSRTPSWDSRMPLWAPSDVHSANSDEIPHAMTQAGIGALIARVRALGDRRRGRRPGRVEVHAADEYLLGEFLSPLNNRRDDDYGGPLAEPRTPGARGRRCGPRGRGRPRGGVADERLGPRAWRPRRRRRGGLRPHGRGHRSRRLPQRQRGDLTRQRPHRPADGRRAGRARPPRGGGEQAVSLPVFAVGRTRGPSMPRRSSPAATRTRSRWRAG